MVTGTKHTYGASRHHSDVFELFAMVFCECISDWCPWNLNRPSAPVGDNHVKQRYTDICHGHSCTSSLEPNRGRTKTSHEHAQQSKQNVAQRTWTAIKIECGPKVVLSVTRTHMELTHTVFYFVWSSTYGFAAWMHFHQFRACRHRNAVFVATFWDFKLLTLIRHTTW